MLKYITKASDLVTSRAATVEGFLAQAREKTYRARPLVASAIALWEQLQTVPTIHACATLKAIRPQLLAAAGFSQKSLNHLSDQEQQDALEKALMAVDATSPQEWRMDVFCRYLLTLGDGFGGTMRNVTGAFGGARFVDAVMCALEDAEHKPSVTKSKKGKIQTIAWPRRILALDKKPRFIGKNIDVILLDARKLGTSFEMQLEQACDYLACGELKGGIDPAGADEHWKTANSALTRIRTACAPTPPKLFFVGAAIENSMSEEIFAQLQDGRLAHAANLTKPNQLQDLVKWLISL